MTANACRIVPHAPPDVRLRQRHVVSPDTAAAVLERRKGHTLRWLAKYGLHYDESFASTLSHVIKQTPGCITLAGENMLRRRLDLPPITVAPKRTSGKSAWTGERKQRREAGGWTQAQVIDAGLALLVAEAAGLRTLVAKLETQQEGAT